MMDLRLHQVGIILCHECPCVADTLPAVTYLCVFMRSWQCLPPAGVGGVVVVPDEMLVRQSLPVTSGTSLLEAHAAALRTICQVS